jgi:hypothetical protein
MMAMTLTSKIDYEKLWAFRPEVYRLPYQTFITMALATEDMPILNSKALCFCKRT